MSRLKPEQSWAQRERISREIIMKLNEKLGTLNRELERTRWKLKAKTWCVLIEPKEAKSNA